MPRRAAIAHAFHAHYAKERPPGHRRDVATHLVAGPEWIGDAVHARFLLRERDAGQLGRRLREGQFNRQVSHRCATLNAGDVRLVDLHVQQREHHDEDVLAKIVADPLSRGLPVHCANAGFSIVYGSQWNAGYNSGSSLPIATSAVRTFTRCRIACSAFMRSRSSAMRVYSRQGDGACCRGSAAVLGASRAVAAA